MKKGRLLIKLLVFQFAIFQFSPSLAQVHFNADSMMHAAHDKAIAGKYRQAVVMAEKILQHYPEYIDAGILKARVFAWKKDYTTAINEVSELIRSDKKNYDANSALCDFYLWKEDYSASRKTAQKALEYYPDDEQFLLKVLQADFVAEDYENAQKSGEYLLGKYSKNEEAKEILRTVRMRDWKNEIRLEHYFDGYNDPWKRRWHMSSFGYGLNTSAGVFYAKAYMGDLVQEGEVLYETDRQMQYALEFYPKINKYNYMFLNYSFSEDELFPENRIGAEYYHVFKRSGVEMSLGYRYMHFTPFEKPDVDVQIYTGSIGKYFDGFWVSARPYYTDNGEDQFMTYSVSIRTFLKPEMSYVEWLIGTGTSPENPAFYSDGPPEKGPNTWRVEMTWKQRISKLMSFELETGFVNYQNNAERNSNQLIVRGALSFLF